MASMEPVGVTVVGADGLCHHTRWRDTPMLRCGPWTILVQATSAAGGQGGQVEWAVAASERRPARRVVLHLEGGPGAARVVHREGWQSWSATGARLERRPPTCPPWAARSLDGGVARPRGAADAVAVLARGNEAVAVGFLSARRHFGQVAPAAGRGAAVACTALVTGLSPGPEPTPLDPVGWWAAATPGRALAAYADAVALRNRARTGAPRVAGWCSWAAHGREVTAPLLRDTLARLSEWRDCLRVVQLDDGIQAATGDWLATRPEVGAPLPELVDAIARAGFVPGLWTAPFAAARGSRLARAHPSWLLRDRAGAPAVCMPWMDDAAALDCSQPGVREHIRETFARIRGLGVGYVKADFCFAAAISGGRRSPGWTAAAALGAGLEAVRAGLGPAAHLVLCGCPWLTAVGVADSFRVAADVTRAWRPVPDPTVPLPRGGSAPAAANAVLGSLRRAWMHRRLWLNDPDCVLRTGVAPAVRETLSAVAAAAGGAVMLSDPADRLGDRDHEAVLELLRWQAGLDRPMTAEWHTDRHRVVFTRDSQEGPLTLAVDRRRGGVRVAGPTAAAGAG